MRSGVRSKSGRTLSDDRAFEPWFLTITRCRARPYSPRRWPSRQQPSSVLISKRFRGGQWIPERCVIRQRRNPFGLGISVNVRRSSAKEGAIARSIPRRCSNAPLLRRGASMRWTFLLAFRNTWPPGFSVLRAQFPGSRRVCPGRLVVSTVLVSKRLSSHSTSSPRTLNLEREVCVLHNAVCTRA